MQKGLKTLRNFQKKYKKLLLGFLDGNFAEFLELLHELEGGLAGACTGSLVALDYLGFCINLEEVNVRIDEFYEFFHVRLRLMVRIKLIMILPVLNLRKILIFR